MINNT